MPFLLHTPRSPFSSVSLSSLCAHCPPTGSTQLPSLLIYPTVPLESSLLTNLGSSLNVDSTSWTPIKVDAPLSVPTQKATFLPCYRLQIAEMFSCLTSVSAPLLLPISYRNLSLPKFMESSYFFTIFCGHDVVNVPDLPVFGTELPVSTIVLDDFSVSEENPLHSLGTVAHSFYLSSVLAICLQGYTLCCFTT